jgi:hypothetical protein
MTTRWSVVLALLLCTGVSASPGMVSLSVDRATGSFTLNTGPEFQFLTVSGRMDSASTRSTASLPEDPRVLELQSSSGALATTNTVRFVGLGEMTYEFYAGAARPRGRLLTTTVPEGRCKEIDRWPVVVQIAAIQTVLQMVDRSWEHSPQSADWARVLSDLSLFLLGTDFASDCSALARPQDRFGCDPPAAAFSCGQWGACCDEHDRCYSKHGCSSASWGCYLSEVPWFGRKCEAGGGEPCHTCNKAAVACFAQRPGPGPSECCSCTEPRGCPDGVKPCGAERKTGDFGIAHF